MDQLRHCRRLDHLGVCKSVASEISHQRKQNQLCDLECYYRKDRSRPPAPRSRNEARESPAGSRGTARFRRARRRRRSRAHSHDGQERCAENLPGRASRNRSRRARRSPRTESHCGEAGRGWRRIAPRQATHAASPGIACERLREESRREAQLKSASLQYANALADVALAQGAAKPVLKQLNDFGTSYADSAELRNFLSSPAVTREAKPGVIEKITARMRASRILRNFLFIIVDRQRMHML